MRKSRFWIAAALALALVAPAQAEDTLPRRLTLGAAAANQTEPGVRIVQVIDGAPAALAGLAVGDIVLRIDGRDLANTQDFVTAVRSARAGRSAEFAIVRDGQALTLAITLVEAPREAVPGLDITYGAVRVGDALQRTIVAAPRGGARQRLPAVLLIGGIGCYSIDDARNQDAPYRRLAYDLARRGMVVMRVEKSSMGDSQGPPCASVDFETELAGYDAGLRALMADRRVDSERVFVFGHSIGTISAPRLAANNGVAGVIAAQGLGRTWFEYELINTRRQIELGGANAAAVDEAMRAKAACAARVLLAGEPAQEVFAQSPECAELVPLPASQAYMRQLTEVNPGHMWTAFEAPVLLIYGDADFVTDRADHERLLAIANSSRAGRAELTIIEGMDHFLSRADSQSASFARLATQQPPGAYHEELSTVVGDWICARAHCRAR